MIEIDTGSKDWDKAIASAQDAAVSGQVRSKDIPHILRGYRKYGVLDVSGAVFVEETDTHPQCLGYSHCGPVYSSRIVTTVTDPLKELLTYLSADLVVLPDNVARRHMNVIGKNLDIHSVKVSDGCRLFSMKDGDVWNRKGDKLVFKQRMETAVCPDCHRGFNRDELYATAYRTRVCQSCLHEKYVQCTYCLEFFRSEDIRYGELTELPYCENCKNLAQ